MISQQEQKPLELNSLKIIELEYITQSTLEEESCLTSELALDYLINALDYIRHRCTNYHISDGGSCAHLWWLIDHRNKDLPNG
jgi:hypothetical protein